MWKIVHESICHQTVYACRDTESMMPEIPEPTLVNIGPESSGGAPADKVEMACGTDELFHEPFQVTF